LEETFRLRNEDGFAAMLDDCFRADGTPLIPTDNIAALAQAYLDNDRAALDAVLAKYPRDNAGSVYRQFEREEQVIGLVHGIANFMALALAAAGSRLQQFLARRGIRPDLAARTQQVFNTAKLVGGTSAVQGAAAAGPEGAFSYGAQGALSGVIFSGAYQVPYVGGALGLGTFTLFNLMQGDMRPQEAFATAAAQSFLYSSLAGGCRGPGLADLRSRVQSRAVAPEYQPADPGALRRSPEARLNATYHRYWKHSLPPADALRTLNEARAGQGLKPLRRPPLGNRRWPRKTENRTAEALRSQRGQEWTRIHTDEHGFLNRNQRQSVQSASRTPQRTQRLRGESPRIANGPPARRAPAAPARIPAAPTWPTRSHPYGLTRGSGKPAWQAAGTAASAVRRRALGMIVRDAPPPRSPGSLPADFPKLLHLTNRNFFHCSWETPDQFDKRGRGPTYLAAKKGGDIEAAVRLAKDTVKPVTAVALKQRYPKAKLLYVHAKEASSKNKIPVALAHHVSNLTGMGVIDSVQQINSTSHTDAPFCHRLITPPQFDGYIEPGTEVVLLDYISTMGGTLARLYKFVVEQGGRVRAATALGSLGSRRTGADGRVLALQPDTEARIIRQYGPGTIEGILHEYGYESLHELTDSQARSILTYCPNAHALRARCAQARSAAGGSVLPRILRERLGGAGPARGSTETPCGGVHAQGRLPLGNRRRPRTARRPVLWPNRRETTLAMLIRRGVHAMRARRAKKGGATHKRWIGRTDKVLCPACAENHAAGWRRIDTSFPSGHAAPPAHHNCRCRLVFAKRETEGPPRLIRNAARPNRPAKINPGYTTPWVPWRGQKRTSSAGDRHPYGLTRGSGNPNWQQAGTAASAAKRRALMLGERAATSSGTQRLRDAAYVTALYPRYREAPAKQQRTLETITARLHGAGRSRPTRSPRCTAPPASRRTGRSRSSRPPSSSAT
jgi:hypothetical protein